MPERHHRLSPVVENLETRLAMSATPVAAIAPATPPVTTPPPGLVAGQANLKAFAFSYLSYYGQARYNPALDFNGNGFIGQGDVGPLLRALTPYTKRMPQQVYLTLAPGDQVHGHHPANSGGVTRQDVVTILGHTTPNSIVFSDALSGPRAGNYRFRGPAIAVDAQGNFSQTINITKPTAPGQRRPQGSLTNVDYLIYDPYGHHVIRDFPIVQLPI